MAAAKEARSSGGPLRLERRPDGVAVLWLDVPGERVNTLRRGFDEAFHRVLDDLESDAGLLGGVFASAKRDSFAVGADIALLAELRSAEEGTALARIAQQVMSRLAGFPKPLVAAIHGDCLGGGLELAMACSGGRVASSSPATRLGQPEVRLGLIPGAGGTQRLPRLAGLEAALDLILTGRQVASGSALELGIVDEVVHQAVLLEVAAERVRRIAEHGAGSVFERARKAIGSALPRDLKALLLEENPAGRRVLFSQAEKRVRARVGDTMPAPFKALEVVRIGVEDGVEAGLTAEAEAFGKLVVTSQARSLVSLFRARSELEHETGVLEAEAPIRPVAKVAVVGAGLMGSGIARVTASPAAIPVRLRDLDDQALRGALRSIRRSLERDVDKGRLAPRDPDRILSLVRPTTDYTGFGRADVVIEAVVEDLEVKQQVMREVEEHCRGEAIFASNTSSLPITRLARASSAPERVIGMHYFSPVDRIPLLEVVACERTAPWVVATCVELGKRQGKTVIVVRDGPGFYTSRILAPYLNEALRLLGEGLPVESIDRALTDFGFPVGPLELLDEVGLDVAHEIGRVLYEAFGERMEPASVEAALLEDGRRGRKNGRGFYRYERGQGGRHESRDEADRTLYALLGTKPREDGAEPAEIVRRCVLAMVNEAVLCFDEDIVGSARDADVGAVFGLGFPPFRGGPLRWIDSRGASRTLGELEDLEKRFGARFAPAQRLRQQVGAGIGFHDG